MDKPHVNTVDDYGVVSGMFYIMMGLLVVNIICMVIYCWNKCRVSDHTVKVYESEVGNV